jgi:hypothetical protein
VEWEVIDKPPKFPKLKVPESKWDFYTREESEQLLSKATAKLPDSVADLEAARAKRQR